MTEKLQYHINYLKIFYFVIVVCILRGTTLQAQKTVTRFQHYTTTQGLSQNMVDCMLKDHNGFLWFGTWNGLNRFDGYNFVVYKQNPGNSTSISNNFISGLTQDSFKNIWVATRDGLNVYLYNSEKFIRYKKDLNDQIKFDSYNISNLLIDSDNTLWVGTFESGLYCLKILDQHGNVEVIGKYQLTKEEGSISSNEINCIYEDSRKNIWVGTSNGLNQWNRKSKKFIHFRNNPFNPNTLSYNVINAIYEDKNGNLWVGTEFGLNKYDYNRINVSRYYYSPEDINSLAHNTVRAITEDYNGKLVIGTLGGLSNFQPSLNNFNNQHFNLHDKYGLNNEFINCLLSDKEGNLWIGTEKGGVNKLNVFQHKFELYENEINNKNSLSHNTINSIFEDEEKIWIGTAGGGLNIYFKKTGKFQHHFFDPHITRDISANFVTVIFRDSHKDTWIGSWGGGLYKLPANKEIRGNLVHYTSTGLENSIVDPFISSIAEDRNGNLWIGTLRGLSIFERKTGRFTTFSGSDGKANITRIGCLQFDFQGNLWIGTIEGLYQIVPFQNGLIDNSKSRYNYFSNIEEDKNSLSGNYVISICSDKNNNLWFGTYGNGLNKLIPSAGAQTTRFLRFDENDGLSSNVIYGILEDSKGNLWLSTDNGLTKFNPEKKICKTYHEADGLISNQYYWSAYYKNSKGKMYFGGMNGLNAFYPDSIKDIGIAPNIVFTEFRIHNTLVLPGQEVFGKIAFENSIVSTNEVVLSYKANEFSIEFAALHFYQPEKNQYMYKLDGFDKNWIRVDAKRRYANYTNLKGGTYTFMVKAASSDGYWSNKPASIKIRIIPPFWATWWFKILLFLILLGSIISYNRLRVLSLKRQKEKLEKLVNIRTIQLEEQKHELQTTAELLSDSNQQLTQRQTLIEGQKNELVEKNKEILEQRDKLIELNKKVQITNKQQIKLFTHISHEFRTPLTLILAPVEQLIAENPNPKQNNKLLLIQKNAQRMLHLVDQLMELRKVETGKSELHLINADLAKFILEISQSFSSVSIERRIDFFSKSYPSMIITDFDKDKIENIVYNLLSNAFKYTPANRSISLTVGLTKNTECGKNEISIVNLIEKGELAEEYVEIIVSDSGTGISQDQIKEIFKRFYRINTPFTQKAKGTGIGLYITKEMVREHHGLLFVSSIPGIGSSFRILLPAAGYFSKVGIESIKSEDIQYNQKALISLSNIHDEHIANIQDNINQSGELYEKSKTLILIVDDDNDLLAYIGDFLSVNYQVVVASNGKQGLEIAQTQSPDIIVSDVMMPEMDGIELCNSLKNDINTSHIPVILLSARAETENYLEGLGSGADDYIPKPFNTLILEAKIKSLIENRLRLKRIFAEQTVTNVKELTTNKADEQFMEKAFKTVLKNINVADFSVEAFASEMFISRSLLHKKLTAIVGQSANDFIITIRMKKAMALLREKQYSISEIAHMIGFNDPKYFSKCFKKQFGKSPSEFE